MFVIGNWVNGNLKRLLIGQSFMVVFCSFTLAQLTTFPTYPNVFDINDETHALLFCSGLPGIVLTVTIAQLTPSLLAKEYPLRFLNIPGIYHIIVLALYLEKCGIMHFVYILYGILNSFFFETSAKVERDHDQYTVPSVSNMEEIQRKNITVSVTLDESSDNSHSESTGDISENTGEVTISLNSNGSTPVTAKYRGPGTLDVERDKGSAFVTGMTPLEKKDDSTPISNGVQYVKYTLSTTMMVLSFTFVFYCLAMGHSLIDVSFPVQLLLLFLSMTIITYCEGMKVSIVSTSHIESEDLKESHRIAYKVHKLLNVDVSEGIKKFLLGRQLTVVPLGFFIASLTHFVGLHEESMPYGLYYIIVTAGLPGVMILLQVAQLTPQLLAEQNNIAFINLPGCYILAKWALFVESFGILNVTWMFYYTIDKLVCRRKSRLTTSYDQLDSSSSGLFAICYDSDSSCTSEMEVQRNSDERKTMGNPLQRSEYGVQV